MKALMMQKSIPYLRKALLLLLILSFIQNASAQENTTDEIPARFGFAVISGNSMDPVSDIHFFQVSAFGVWDHDKVWHYWAPENMRFKVELNAGATVSPNIRTVLSAEMMGLYYLKSLDTETLSPFFTSGIGLIYTDFQTRDQGPPEEEMGRRLNFNPQIGFGMDIETGGGPPCFAEVRLSHISNADTDDQNRGLNSVVFLFGRYF